MTKPHHRLFRNKSDEHFAKAAIDDHFDPTYHMKSVGDKLINLKQARLYITLYIPEDQWTSDDYLRVMQCYQYTILLEIYFICNFRIGDIKELMAREDIQFENFNIGGINDDLDSLNTSLRNAREFYTENKNHEVVSIDYHLAAFAAFLKHHYKLVSGKLSYNEDAALNTEKEAALNYIQYEVFPTLRELLSKTPPASLEPAQLRMLANVNRAITGIYAKCQLVNEAMKSFSEVIEIQSLMFLKTMPSIHDTHYIYDTLPTIALAMKLLPAQCEKAACANIRDIVHLWSKFMPPSNYLEPKQIDEVYDATTKQHRESSSHEYQLLLQVLKLIRNNYQQPERSDSSITKALQDERTLEVLNRKIETLEAGPRVSNLHTLAMFKAQTPAEPTVTAAATHVSQALK